MPGLSMVQPSIIRWPKMVAMAILDLLHQGFRRSSDVGRSIRSLMSDPRRPIGAGAGMDANIFAEGVDFSTTISVQLEGGMKKGEPER